MEEKVFLEERIILFQMYQIVPTVNITTRIKTIRSLSQ